MDEKPDGGLRNTLYDQQTRSGRRLTRSRLLLYHCLVPLALGLLGIVWRWSRVVSVIGTEHITGALVRAPSFIPVYWHQNQIFASSICLIYAARASNSAFSSARRWTANSAP